MLSTRVLRRILSSSNKRECMRRSNSTLIDQTNHKISLLTLTLPAQGSRPLLPPLHLLPHTPPLPAPLPTPNPGPPLRTLRQCLHIRHTPRCLRVARRLLLMLRSLLLFPWPC